MQTMWTTSTRDDDYFKKLQKQAKARIVVTLTELPTYQKKTLCIPQTVLVNMKKGLANTLGTGPAAG